MESPMPSDNSIMGFSFVSRQLESFCQRLNDNKIKIRKFKDNMPGYDWHRQFMKRRTELTTRRSSNIKRSRVTLNPKTIADFL